MADKVSCCSWRSWSSFCSGQSSHPQVRTDTHSLPVFAQCPGSWSVLGAARGAQSCRPTHPWEHTRTPRSQCSPGTPAARRCRGSSTPQGCRAHAALVPVQSGCDLGREWQRPCPRQPCLQPSLAMRQGDPRAATQPLPATAEPAGAGPPFKATPAQWLQWIWSGHRALPISGKYISRLRDKLPSMIWQ